MARACSGDWTGKGGVFFGAVEPASPPAIFSANYPPDANVLQDGGDLILLRATPLLVNRPEALCAVLQREIELADYEIEAAMWVVRTDADHSY
jgi:hypothetical protein